MRGQPSYSTVRPAAPHNHRRLSRTPFRSCLSTRRWGSGWGKSGFVRFRADCTGAGSQLMYSDPYITVPIRA